MNLLAKTIANRGLISSSSPKKCLLLLQQSSRFASTTRKPKIPIPLEPSLSPYTLTPPKIEIDEGKRVFSWRRPSEIPYQAKVANSVDLIGFVQTPVQFEASPDGKYCAGTLVVHQNRDDSSAVKIPVVFMGDLAHVVACHVRQNDCVYVSGKFSIDPLPFKIIDEYQGGFHIVAESVNFVQGLNRKASVKGREELVVPTSKAGLLDDNDNQHSDLSDFVNSGSGNGDWTDLIKNPKQWWDFRKAKTDGLVKIRHPDFKKKDKDSSTSLWLNNKVPGQLLKELEGIEFDVYGPQEAPKSKGAVHDMDSWDDLLRNPDKWWDNRATKLSKNSPDFKQKSTGIGLWLSNAPDCVLSRLPPLRDGNAASSS